jgi:hypothetical protein
MPTVAHPPATLSFSTAAWLKPTAPVKANRLTVTFRNAIALASSRLLVRQGQNAS